MEVFVAIILLFGTLSIGSATLDDSDDDPLGVEISTAANDKQDLSGQGAEIGGVEHTPLADCLAERHFVIYRDLTTAYKNKSETATPGASDSEEAYPDE